MKLPASTLANISPPDRTGYEFFRNWTARPLNPSGEFNAVNAWRLAEIALLNYDSEDAVAEHLKAMEGFTGHSHTQNETEYLIVRGEADVIVSFRGTEIDNFWGAVSDWLTDFKFRQERDAQGSGIHRGFTAALDKVWDDLVRELQQIPAKRKERIWFTGHSLGAALATLAAYRAVSANPRPFDVHAVYVYGSPRIGDSSFRDRVAQTGLHQRLFRIRNNADVIARLPPFPNYCHVGRPQFIDNFGHVHREQEPQPEESLAVIAETIAEVLHLLPSLDSDARSTRIIEGAIADHSPTAYTIHLLNHSDRR